MGFPIIPEVLETIFSYLDGRTLNHVSLVDTTWNHEIKRMKSKLDTWRRFIQEIPKSDLIELTTNLDFHLPLPQLDNLPKACLLSNWRSVYINWWLWTRISRWSTHTSCFTIPEVTCAKLSGDSIVTGHMSGEIRVWDREGNLLAISCTHSRKIEDLLLVALGYNTELKKDMCLNFKPRGHLGLAHHCVISTSLDERLGITYFVGSNRINGHIRLDQPDYFRERAIIAARVIPNTAYILVVDIRCKTEIGVIYKAEQGKYGRLMLRPENSFEFPGTVNNSTINCFPPKTVAALTTINGKHAFFQINLDHENGNKVTLTSLCQDKDFMQDIKIFRANICIWIANGATTILHIHTNGLRRRYEVRPKLPAVPSCFLLHGSVLFMGTSMGSLIAFDARELPKLDLGKPLWTTHLKCGPIVTIHALGSDYDLRLIATSRTRMFYFKFDTHLCMPAMSFEG